MFGVIGINISISAILEDGNVITLTTPTIINYINLSKEFNEEHLKEVLIKAILVLNNYTINEIPNIIYNQIKEIVNTKNYNKRKPGYYDKFSNN